MGHGITFQVSKKFFPQLAVGYDDPRVKLFVGDGMGFSQCYAGPCLCSSEVAFVFDLRRVSMLFACKFTKFVFKGD